MIDRLLTFPPIRKLNSGWFHYRANRWRFGRRFEGGNVAPIDRPVYLLGTQNGGLTLLARILHRHPQAISVTGDHRYWAGEDETQDAMADILPEDFGWRRVDLPDYPLRNHSWVYGSDAFLPYYRRRAGETDLAAGARYRRILQSILRMNGPGKRFIDKSQSLTLRVGALHDALGESDPRFVLVSRDPFAVVWGQATRNGVVSALSVSLEEKVQICAQHWANSFFAALADAEADPTIKLRHWRFEDILMDPETHVAEICAFTDLRWLPEILPGPNDHVPWGSRIDAFNKRKWYPLRPDVNDRYRTDLPQWAAQIIAKTCGELADRFGYCEPVFKP
ncbi:MAG: hypothetical protein ACJA09_000901 [Alcanivorax sp.]|jgi:hypothetical protein